jgi:hypothetical protein
MAVFEDEESARVLVERGPGLMPDDSPIRIMSLDVYEVVASG